MKSKKLEQNKITGMFVGECVCKKCTFRNGRNFSACQKRDKIPTSIILGDKECRLYKSDNR